MKVTRIDLQILGDRNFPIATARINEEQCRDFPTVLDAALKLNPSTTPEDVARAIWRYGTRALQGNLARRIPIRVETLPGVRTEKEEARSEVIAGRRALAGGAGDRD